MKKLKLNRYQQLSIQSFIDGKRSVAEIRNAVIADTGTNLSFERLIGYLDMLKELSWVNF